MCFNPPKRNLNCDGKDVEVLFQKGFNPPKRNLNVFYGRWEEDDKKGFNPPKRNLNWGFEYRTPPAAILFQSTKEEFKQIINRYLQLRKLSFQSTKEEFKRHWM